MRPIHLLPFLLLAGGTIAAAQTVTPPQDGGPQPGREGSVGRDAGPADHAPRTASPDAVNRGTDGSVAGRDRPGTTGTTPQGMHGDSTAGARAPHKPPPSAPPR